MTKASDNLFPSVLFDEADPPTAPSAGSQRLYLNSSNLNVINSAGTIRVVGSGGGGMTYSAVGTTSVGGTAVAAVANQQYMKKVTLASASIVLSIGVYMKTNVDGASGLVVAFLADATGNPADILAISGSQTQNYMVQESSNAASGPEQWVHLPIGLYVAAGDYWLAWQTFNAQINFYYDAGSDVIASSGASPGYTFDGRRYANSNSSRNYSVRAHILS